jgi:glycosyltransferase involved in cell wall biosynthesis
MKILFIARNTIFTDSGGDTVQMNETAAGLRALGIEIVIKTASDKPDYKSFDLIHFFNITRPADLLKHISKSNLPFVISTIYVDYGEFEKEQRKGIAGFIFRFMSNHLAEYVKTMAKSLLHRSEAFSWQYALWGHNKSVIYVANRAAMLLPNSENEYRRLKENYNITTPYNVITNGVNRELFVNDKLTVQKDPLLVICAGRIEGRKNQLLLIEALNNTKYQLILIGDCAPNQISYYKLCRKKAASNISFINRLPQQELRHYYQKAKVHVLPSWFETTGLTSLEAGIMGCNIVVADKGDVREYFGDRAFYCNPSSAASIFEAVEKAASIITDNGLSNFIKEHYTWQKAAEKTASVYKSVLLKSNE